MKAYQAWQQPQTRRKTHRKTIALVREKNMLAATMNLTRVSLLNLIILFVTVDYSFATALLSGPMQGHTTYTTAKIWAQCEDGTSARIHYWPIESPAEKNASNTVRALNENHLVVKFQLRSLKRNTTYAYQLEMIQPDQTQENSDVFTLKLKPYWRHVGDGKQVPDFKVAFGSCAYINEKDFLWEDTQDPEYGKQYQIFDAIVDQTPDLMLWLGDNLYLTDQDWQTPQGIAHRYSHGRQQPIMQKLLQGPIHYAVWDDHDFGPNNSARNFWNKKATLDAFKRFWAHPPFIGEGITRFFNWGDVNFYLLDNRWFRAPSGLKGKPKPFLGKEQVDWLVESLAHNQSQSSFVHRSTFNVVVCGSQVLSDAYNSENYYFYREEWKYLMDRLLEERISGVVFLSGDVHHGGISKRSLKNKDKQTHVFVEITSSPLTAGVNAKPSKNSFRVGSPITQRNFASLDFSGPIDDREMRVQFHDSNGQAIDGAEHTFKFNDLRAPKRPRN